MEETKNFLTDTLYELHAVTRMLRESIEDDVDLSMPTAEVMVMLLDVTSKKLDYYQRKYGFDVPRSDTFYIQDLPKYIEFGKDNGEGVSA